MRVLYALIVYFTFAIVHYDFFFSFMLTDEWNDGAGGCICIVLCYAIKSIQRRYIGVAGHVEYTEKEEH